MGLGLVKLSITTCGIGKLEKLSEHLARWVGEVIDTQPSTSLFKSLSTSPTQRKIRNARTAMLGVERWEMLVKLLTLAQFLQYEL